MTRKKKKKWLYSITTIMTFFTLNCYNGIFKSIENLFSESLLLQLIEVDRAINLRKILNYVPPSVDAIKKNQDSGSIWIGRNSNHILNHNSFYKIAPSCGIDRMISVMCSTCFRFTTFQLKLWRCTYAIRSSSCLFIVSEIFFFNENVPNKCHAFCLMSWFQYLYFIDRITKSRAKCSSITKPVHSGQIYIFVGMDLIERMSWSKWIYNQTSNNNKKHANFVHFSQR